MLEEPPPSPSTGSTAARRRGKLRYVTIAPHGVFFVGKSTESVVSISNEVDTDLAFSIRCSKKHALLMRPATGFIPSHETIRVCVFQEAGTKKKSADELSELRVQVLVRPIPEASEYDLESLAKLFEPLNRGETPPDIQKKTLSVGRLASPAISQPTVASSSSSSSSSYSSSSASSPSLQFPPSQSMPSTLSGDTGHQQRRVEEKTTLLDAATKARYGVDNNDLAVQVATLQHTIHTQEQTIGILRSQVERLQQQAVESVSAAARRASASRLLAQKERVLAFVPSIRVAIIIVFLLFLGGFLCGFSSAKFISFLPFGS